MAESLGEFTDADLRGTMAAALRLLAVLAAVAGAIFWWKRGWPSGAMLLIGAAISGASLWEWMRLMTAINQRMDAGGAARPMGSVVAGFLLRLCLTLAVLYGSLKYLHGTVLALATGLGLAVLSLTIQALKLLRRWSA
jgi:hypothetical protein